MAEPKPVDHIPSGSMYWRDDDGLTAEETKEVEDVLEGI